MANQSVEQAPAAADEVLPTWDVPEAIALPSPATNADDLPVAEPINAAPEAKSNICSCCQSPRLADASFCSDCGFMFAGDQQGPETPAAPAPSRRLAGRYEIKELITRRGNVCRYRGLDHGGGDSPAPIVIVEMPEATVSSNESAGLLATVLEINLDDPQARPGLEEPLANGEHGTETPNWPSPAWERRVLQSINHPAMPGVLDFLSENDRSYLIESAPAGRVLWDAWDDPSATVVERFRWLAELAEGLRDLHNAGAILEGIRPDIVVVTPDGHAVFADVTDLIPLPVPEDAAIQGYAYTAPELILARQGVDARADLYSFGAMLYALHLGRELTDLDFERQGVPQPFIARFPDAHPALARVIMKTFVRDRRLRFPTDEAGQDDPSGFTELIHALTVAGRLLSHVRLDIAGWTNTGMVRTGNEDTFAWYHASASQKDDIGERALIILADGMGGHEAGEIASVMAVDSLGRQLRDPLLQMAADGAQSRDSANAADVHSLLSSAMTVANQEIYEASLSSEKYRRGMGCTAEVVYLDGRRLIAAHVGDSRTYHYSAGRLLQLTIDHTLVNRLVELGQLTATEAETHPRRNELQQALGCRPEVWPSLHSAELRPGDWVIICSDGLTNHVDNETVVEIIQHSDSAEKCARSLVNLTNLQGGTDNCTVIVVRAT